jgi:hypothetical protein
VRGVGLVLPMGSVNVFGAATTGGWFEGRQLGARYRVGRYLRRDHAERAVPEQPSATGVSISSIDTSVPRRERKVP